MTAPYDVGITSSLSLVRKLSRGKIKQLALGTQLMSDSWSLSPGCEAPEWEKQGERLPFP